MQISKTRANLMLLGAAIIWGAGYIFSKLATNAGMHAGLINAIRGFIYAGLAYLFFHRAINHMTKADLRVGLIAGGINFLGYQVQTIGLMYTTPANNAFLTAIYVVLVPFIVWLFFHQRPEPKSYLAIMICVVGMAFLTGVFSHGLSLHLGDLLTILSAFFYALQIVYFGSVTETSPWVLAFMLGVVQGVGGLFYTGLFERQTYAAIDWQAGLWPVIVLGIISSFGAQTLQVVGQRFTDPTPAGLILMTESMFGSIFSVAFGFEPFTQDLLIGGGLIIFALLLMQVGLRRLWQFRRRT
ncbi:MAG: DMT family transporter [Lactobacillus sp.]|jgi:drug/metabolite transporter (DMT)-like permease|nr:DMT family transporter [Lactobacillus sp.]MCI2032014.1 DMT family transporter [Lactobacillus sp.]